MGMAPYDKRNEKDYADITVRIEAVLKRMENNDTIPATEAELCKLAKCSRGTLRNRKWPLERLKEIKKERKKKKGGRRKRITRAHLTAVEVHIEDKNRLEAQLEKSRAEAAKWFHKFMDSEKENKKLRRVNEGLRAARQQLQQKQVDEYQQSGSEGSKSATEQGRIDKVVVPFPQAGQAEESAEAQAERLEESQGETDGRTGAAGEERPTGRRRVRREIRSVPPQSTSE